MLTTVRNIAIACTLVAAFTLPTKAQTESGTGLEFDKIEVGEDSGWEFKSENESISVEDDLKELQEYSISDTDESDVRLIEEDRRWGNRGDARDYSIETEVYGY